jgi:Uma2 family endonuclease
MRSPIPVFSVAEYLEAESKSELRHEYLGGQIFAMAGGSKAHNIITLNIASRLRSQLRGGASDVFMSDMKVKLSAANQNQTIFYYPDVVVTYSFEDQDLSLFVKLYLCCTMDKHLQDLQIPYKKMKQDGSINTITSCTSI